MEPNIERKGQLIRGTGGLLLVIAATLLIILAWPPTWWQWIVAVIMLLVGGFGLFEAKRKWCLLRAYDIKTPL